MKESFWSQLAVFVSAFFNKGLSAIGKSWESEFERLVGVKPNDPQAALNAKMMMRELNASRGRAWSHTLQGSVDEDALKQKIHYLSQLVAHFQITIE